MKQLTDAEKNRQIHREAKASLLAFFLIAAWWFVTGFGLKNVDVTVFHMPLWVLLSTWGTWVVSIIAVVYLVKKVFVDFDLEGKK